MTVAHSELVCADCGQDIGPSACAVCELEDHEKSCEECSMSVVPVLEWHPTSDEDYELLFYHDACYRMSGYKTDSPRDAP